MSIIYEALKKIEKSQSIKPGESKKPDKKDVILSVIAGIIFICAFVVFFNLISKPQSAALNKPPSSAPVKEETQGNTPQALPLQAAAPASVKEEAVLVLSGIFFEKDKAYCIINNRILKDGDSIEGAKIVKIMMEKVILDSKGKEIILTNSSM